jgi:hypothetical protein
MATKTLFANYHYCLTAEQQSEIQLFLRSLPPSIQANPAWKLVHGLTLEGRGRGCSCVGSGLVLDGADGTPPFTKEIARQLYTGAFIRGSDRDPYELTVEEFVDWFEPEQIDKWFEEDYAALLQDC